MDELIKEAIAYIKLRWHRKSTLLILVLFSYLVFLSMLSGINVRAIPKGNVWINAAFFSTIVVAIWIYTNLTPKASKGKIGFAIGIKIDNPDQQIKIKGDFVETLRELLYKSKYRYSFDFIEIPDHIIEYIQSPDDATRVLHKLDAAFMIYGKARAVKIKGEIQHVLNLEGVVAHKPIASEISKSFSKEFSDLFPRKLMISSEGDLFHFEFTANLVNIVSRYIIGIAALLSGDVEYAQELFESLDADLRKVRVDFPVIIKIQDRLPRRLRDVYLIRIGLLYEDWKRTKNIRDIEKMKPFLDALASVAPGNPDAQLFRSMWFFIVANDIAQAKSECVKGKSKQNISWRYNYAFLFAYEGNLERASKEYKQAFKGYYQEPGFIFDIVDFILWVLNKEPDKTQLYFCLGLIYYYVISDFSLALQEFERFLESTKPNLYSNQKEEAEKIIVVIQKEFSNGKPKVGISID